jgi:hypothetical protein
MTRPVSGNAVPDFQPDHWNQSNDAAAAAAKPQLVETTEAQDEVNAGETHGRAEDISAGNSEPKLPPAPLSDPLTKNAFLALINTKPQLPLDNAISHALDDAAKGVLHADTVGGVTGTATAAKATGPTIASDVTKALDDIGKLQGDGKELAQAKKFAGEAMQAIKTGDYSAAHQSLENLRRIKSNDEVLPDKEKTQVDTMIDQLDFLSGMQKAGIKADYPPNEKQLVDLFSKLKDNPNVARDKFAEYATDFQVHPSNIDTAHSNIDYSHTNTKIAGIDHPTTQPNTWNDVSSHPITKDGFPMYVGKQLNDCEGFGYISEKLLGAAGFKVSNFIGVFPALDNSSSHVMVMFTHPKEKGVTLTSNDKVFTGAKPRDVAKEGIAYAAGGKEKLSGKEEFFVGKTMKDAEVQTQIKDETLKP